MGPVMFVIFINDLQDFIECYNKIYVDDSKIIRVIEYESSAEFWKRDIDSVANWTREWLMKFTSSKCKVMYFGNKNFVSDNLLTI